MHSLRFSGVAGGRSGPGVGLVLVGDAELDHLRDVAVDVGGLAFVGQVVVVGGVARVVAGVDEVLVLAADAVVGAGHAVEGVLVAVAVEVVVVVLSVHVV